MKILGLNKFAKEPAVNTGYVATVVAGIWTVINAIWPNLIPENVQNAITELALILIPTITGWIIRNKVYAPASVAGMQSRIKNLEIELDKTLNQ